MIIISTLSNINDMYKYKCIQLPRLIIIHKIHNCMNDIFIKMFILFYHTFSNIMLILFYHLFSNIIIN